MVWQNGCGAGFGPELDASSGVHALEMQGKRSLQFFQAASFWAQEALGHTVTLEPGDIVFYITFKRGRVRGWPMRQLSSGSRGEGELGLCLLQVFYTLLRKERSRKRKGRGQRND